MVNVTLQLVSVYCHSLIGPISSTVSMDISRWVATVASLFRYTYPVWLHRRMWVSMVSGLVFGMLTKAFRLCSWWVTDVLWLISSNPWTCRWWVTSMLESVEPGLPYYWLCRRWVTVPGNISYMLKPLALQEVSHYSLVIVHYVLTILPLSL